MSEEIRGGLVADKNQSMSTLKGGMCDGVVDVSLSIAGDKSLGDNSDIHTRNGQAGRREEAVVEGRLAIM
jgi:hypothetical protein